MRTKGLLEWAAVHKNGEFRKRYAEMEQGARTKMGIIHSVLVEKLSSKEQLLEIHTNG